MEELITNFSDQYPDVWFLVTTRDPAPQHLLEQCFSQQIPPDTPYAAKSFLSHWKPDIAVWVSGSLHPTLIQEAALQKIRLIMLDTGAAFETSRGWRLLPGLTRTTLRKFDTLLSGDEATSLALISAGAHSDRVQTTGVLELGVSPLPCNEQEWGALGELVATRPIWLAAEIDISELQSILTAHSQALRRSHRLLLIIVPSRSGDGDEFARVLEDNNFAFSRRSTGGEPDADTPTYLADTDDEMGLWFRMAPVSFMGQTFSLEETIGPDPFDAAAFGSVVVHGPMTVGHKVAYDRLGRAGASKLVAHMGELAHAVETLLAPDRAAIMAHAAWQISSAGAEVMELALAALTDALESTEMDDQ